MHLWNLRVFIDLLAKDGDIIESVSNYNLPTLKDKEA